MTSHPRKRGQGSTGRLFSTERDLDPADWDAARVTAHRMLDDMLDHIETLRSRPVWKEPPAEVVSRFREPLPRSERALSDVHGQFLEEILPFGTGNTHPGFMGWVHGGGTVVGMLAEMLAAGLNANLGGRNHMAIHVERQIAYWAAEMLGFPTDAAGLFVTGTSIANFIALLTARNAMFGRDVRATGIKPSEKPVIYAARSAHDCVRRAVEMSGLGSNALRIVPTDQAGRLEVDMLETTIAQDRRRGLRPLMVVGTAGTVDTGAIDDLTEVARTARRHGAWFHVDAAFGAMAALSPRLKPLLAGIELADSVAFDFHKWGQVPYDAGFVLVRDAGVLKATFASQPDYLRRVGRGLAAGDFWPCDYGPDLSRGFRALKTWFTLQVYGADRLGQMVERCCDVAGYLAERIAATSEFELAAPVALNIVCFGARHPAGCNEWIVEELHMRGLAAPSTTTIDGKTVIRAAIVNHRTGFEEADRLVDAALKLKREFENR